MGRGEAACIAIAAQKGWFIASDEKKRFLREAIARVGAGHVLTTVDLFVLAITAGLLSVEEADADKVTLEGRRFKRVVRLVQGPHEVAPCTSVSCLQIQTRSLALAPRRSSGSSRAPLPAPLPRHERGHVVDQP